MGIRLHVHWRSTAAVKGQPFRSFAGGDRAKHPLPDLGVQVSPPLLGVGTQAKIDHPAGVVAIRWSL